ncbi:MAG TPA: glycosyltransferase family 2 protein [Verrucomicrobiae bacterium]
MPAPVKVSVLIPVYNGERHLAECLDSVLAQDFADMEILVSDDGSSDGSAGIIAEYAARDSRVRWWRNPKNLGLTANTNCCIRAAAGEYLKFLHQDDKLLSPSAVRKLVAALEHEPTASLAGCQQHLTGTDARPLGFSRHSGCFPGRQVIIASLEQNTNLIGQPSLTLFRRAQAQRGYDERFTGFMDFEMWCHLLEQGDFAYVAEPLATWRVHEHHQTARTNASTAKDMEHLRFMEVYYAKPWLKAAATGRMLFAQIYYLRKHYGREAEPLTSAMMNQLTARRFVWEWLKHKVARPWEKLARRWQPANPV